ncbi:MAG: hypothetical protein J5696_00900 [Lachnospiraceae bacterium]|nr:hypothetical protein [Lachnospiraceae bacterium]
MDKGYYEFLVPGKPNTAAKAGKIVLIIVCILCIVAVLFGFSIGLILAILAGAGAYFCSMYTDVEYEYLYIEREISIDKVFNKERRKHAETLSVDKVQVFAPEKSSKLDNFGNMQNMKTTDYSCPETENGLKKYVMVYEGGRKILFSLDEEMAKAFKNKIPRVFSDY